MRRRQGGFPFQGPQPYIHSPTSSQRGAWPLRREFICRRNHPCPRWGRVVDQLSFGRMACPAARPEPAGRLHPPREGRSVSVEQRVIEIVCDNLAVNKEQVNRNTNFIEDIGADSLDIVELIMELEEEFDIQIPDDQAEKIKTVGEAIDYIERETQKK